ncbi:MAG: alpha/beta hydrolase-fold protein [Bacteroidia bacterium]|nr:alpha/beta hydrolase-fold protein [Bacteroidia bacterium]
MKKVLLILFLVPLLWSCTSEDLDSYTEDVFSITSGFTEQNYEITVLRPVQLDPTKEYPLVFLLDGHWHYPQVSKDVEKMYRAGDISQVILVGIAYEGLNPNGLAGYSRISELRIDDFTFPKNNDGDEFGGKAENFRNFLEKELLVKLQQDYPEDASERTVMGHSLGGYYGIWEMLTNSDSSIFRNVEAGSPALWWADGFLTALTADLAAQNSASLPFDLHTTMGTLESVTWNAFFDDFEGRLMDRNFENLTYKFERYPRGHAANAEVGFREGIKYFFPPN